MRLSTDQIGNFELRRSSNVIQCVVFFFFFSPPWLFLCLKASSTETGKKKKLEQDCPCLTFPLPSPLSLSLCLSPRCWTIPPPFSLCVFSYFFSLDISLPVFLPFLSLSMGDPWVKRVMTSPRPQGCKTVISLLSPPHPPSMAPTSLTVWFKSSWKVRKTCLHSVWVRAPFWDKKCG